MKHVIVALPIVFECRKECIKPASPSLSAALQFDTPHFHQLHLWQVLYRSMDTLPVELLIEFAELIAADLDPYKLCDYPQPGQQDPAYAAVYTLKSLCLVNRIMSAAAFPSLYSKITVVNVPNVRKLFDTLTSSSELAKHVKALYIHVSRDRNETWDGVQFPILPECLKLCSKRGPNKPDFAVLVEWAERCSKLTTIGMDGAIFIGNLSPGIQALPASLNTLELRHFSDHTMGDPRFWELCASWVTDLRFLQVRGLLREDSTARLFFYYLPLRNTLRRLTLDFPSYDLLFPRRPEEYVDLQSKYLFNPIKFLAQMYPHLEALDTSYIKQDADFVFPGLRSLTFRLYSRSSAEHCLGFALSMIESGGLPDLRTLQFIAYPEPCDWLEENIESDRAREIIASANVEVALKQGGSDCKDRTPTSFRDIAWELYKGGYDDGEEEEEWYSEEDSESDEDGVKEDMTLIPGRRLYSDVVRGARLPARS